MSLSLCGNVNSQIVTSDLGAKLVLVLVPAWCCRDDAAHFTDFCAPVGGVLERRGQTEAAVDLARLTGLYPAGVICEIINEDGTMARVPDLVRFCKKHNLLMVTVADLARYRLEPEYGESLGAIDWLFPLHTRDAAAELGRVSTDPDVPVIYAAEWVAWFIRMRQRSMPGGQPDDFQSSSRLSKGASRLSHRGIVV
jgi:hypothetical protein